MSSNTTKYSKVNLYFEDESRFGLFTRNGKALTAKGVKPICSFRQVFKSLFLFGAFSPITGEHFLLEMPNCNADNFQLFIDEFSKHNEDVFNIMVLDNGAFHKAKSLNIPDNVGLIFIPPYSPELNPSENMWEILKRKFTNKLHKTREDVSAFITQELSKLTKQGVMKTCGFEYVFSNIIWTN